MKIPMSCAVYIPLFSLFKSHFLITRVSFTYYVTVFLVLSSAFAAIKKVLLAFEHILYPFVMLQINRFNMFFM